MSHLQRSCRSAPALLLIAVLAGGCAYGKRQRDIDRTPVIDTGVGATIIYPGQTAPMPGSSQGAPGAGSGTPPDPASGRQGAVAPGQAPVTFIGGAAEDEKRSVRYDEEPLYYKYLLAPVAIVAAPFVALAEKIRGDEEPGPEIPQREHQRPPPATGPPPVDSDTARVRAKEEAMARELEQRAPGSAPTQAGPGTPISIADELAALQRTPTAPGPAPKPAGATPPDPQSDPRFAAADGIVDRDGDGRVDQWIFREDGEIVKNVLDEDGDGRPDRTLHYDRATHRIARVEEDTNLDGVVDSWTEYREGKIVRRRADADGDGQVDTWSYFVNDEIARHESDTTGDGFRDTVRFYEDGRLVREEKDNDGDGRAELTLYYDGDQVTRRDEDTDGDGRVDVISHYENGHLSRRELLDASALATGTTGP